MPSKIKNNENNEIRNWKMREMKNMWSKSNRKREENIGRVYLFIKSISFLPSLCLYIFDLSNLVSIKGHELHEFYLNYFKMMNGWMDREKERDLREMIKTIYQIIHLQTKPSIVKSTNQSIYQLFTWYLSMN